jgi:DNA polymerase-3 subunit gamma/tau
MIQTNDVVVQLQNISEKENIDIEKEAIHTIAKKADGVMRDALSVFDRVVSSAKDVTITYKHVLELLNMLDYDYYFKMTDNLLQSNLSEVYVLFDKILREGFDASFFVLGLAEHFRQLMVAKDPRTHFLLETSEELKVRYLNQADLSPKEFLLSGLDILNKCDYQYLNSQNKRLHVEIALGKICHLKDVFVFNPENIEKKKSELISEKYLQKPKEKTDQQTESNNAGLVSEPDPQINEASKLSEESLNSFLEISKKQTFGSSAISRIPSISDLMDEIRMEDENKKESISSNLSIVEKAINERIETTTSQIVTNVLKELWIEKNGDDLTIFVPSFLAKDILNEEKSLMRTIRDYHFNPLMDINIIVDLSKFPDHQEVVQKKNLSSKEKFDLLNEANPMISDFINNFNLHLES